MESIILVIKKLDVAFEEFPRERMCCLSAIELMTASSLLSRVHMRFHGLTV